jgi:putative Holliday junction resolvase
MPKGVFLIFDFGYKRIGVAVGQLVTATASPLPIIPAIQGIPDWKKVDKLIHDWHPEAFIIGIPTTISGESLYTTEPAKAFAAALEARYQLKSHLVDERLSTKEARGRIFEEGGFRALQKSDIDSMAACVMFEEWLMGGNS